MIININEKIFSDNNETLDFLCDYEIIHRHKICDKCGSTSEIKKLNEKDGCIVYRCKQKGCQATKSFFTSRIPLSTHIQLIYMLLLDVNYKQLHFFVGVSDSTISKIKKKLITVYQSYINARPPVVLGGYNTIVEVDESVISRRGIIRNPTTLDDNTADTIWILGAVERNQPQNFLLKRIQNRTILNISNALEGKIRVCSILHSDGHPSYPAVANNLNVTHCVVNHSRGFRSETGTHTNSIEGFWAHLKNCMRKEHGVARNKVDDWILQYTFKRRFIMKCDRHEFSMIYCEILKYYFN